MDETTRLLVKMAEDVGETRVMSERNQRHLEGINYKLGVLHDDMQAIKGRSKDHTERIERLEAHAQERRDLIQKLGGVKVGWLLALAAIGAGVSFVSYFIK